MHLAWLSAVLQLSRLGRQELHSEPVVTGALVHKTLRPLTHQIARRQVQVTVEPLPVVHADHLALAQIFGNLLAKAVAYLELSRPGAIVIGIAVALRGEPRCERMVMPLFPAPACPSVVHQSVERELWAGVR